eukprot:COSAG01_NODE_3968_length_5483_cov_4.305906_8_plen_51_part_00
MLTCCFCGAVAFRFVFEQKLLELLCWLGLAVLEIYPRFTSMTGARTAPPY